MSIQKKSLISTLKSAKKANLTKPEVHFDNTRKDIKAQPVLKTSQKFKPAVKARPAY
jgi:hypothetical protein